MSQKKSQPLELLAQMLAQLEAEREVEKPVKVAPIQQKVIWSGPGK